jgi:hypothetical protein
VSWTLAVGERKKSASSAVAVPELRWRGLDHMTGVVVEDRVPTDLAAFFPVLYSSLREFISSRGESEVGESL